MKSRVTAVMERIRTAAERAGRDPKRVRLVAVSKTVPADRVREAASAGVEMLGENYVQEAEGKIDALDDLRLSWHFIGHLQSNKAKSVVPRFDLIHSVDRLKLAREIDKQAGKIDKVQPVLIQVNISGEETKSGIDPQGLSRLLNETGRLPNLSVRGLMTMPPFFDDPEGARPYFKALRELRDRLRESLGLPLEELSMGMTGDFEAAVEEGATLVRVGTAIFGKRD